MRKTLFGKILLMSLIVIMVVSGVSGVVTDFFIKRFILHAKQQEMIRQGERVASSFAASIVRIELGGGILIRQRGNWISRINASIMEVEQVLGARIWLVDREGQIYADNDVMRQLNHRDLARLLNNQIVTIYNWNDELNQPVLAVLLPIRIDREVIGGIFILTPMQEIQFIQTQIRKIIFGAALIGGVVAVIMAYLFSRRLSRPILAIQQLIGRMKTGDFTGQIEVNPGDELWELTQHFNELSRELNLTIDLLQTEQEQTHRIIHSMAEGVISMNPERELMVVNPAAKRILKSVNCEQEELKQILQSIPDLQEQLELVLQEKLPLMREVEWEGKMLLSIASPMSMGEGQHTGLVLVLQDITNRWRLVQLQKELIANVSHEFKTPLTSIKGFVELLLDNKITDESALQSSLKIVHSEAVRLTRMVNGLLKMATMEALKLKKESVDLWELISKVVDSFAIKLNETNVQVQLDPQLQRRLVIDPDRMEQVFYNLIDNGIRFSPVGGVIQIRLTQGEEWIDLTFHDQGPGVPEKELELIFDRFYKIEKARSSNESGSGLGLAIAKSIVNEHDGQIWVDNHPEGGAVFTIRLPLSDLII